MASPVLNAVEIEVRYDRTNQLELSRRAGELSSDLCGVIISDQQSLELANELIRAGEQWLKSVDAIMDPVREATHRAWKAAIKAQDDFKAPVAGPLAVLKSNATQFVVNAKAEVERKQREAEAEQRRKNDAEAKRVAAELKALGASPSEIKAAKEEVKAVAAPIVQPTVETPTGQSIRTLYSAELVSLPDFITYLLTDQTLLRIFSASEVIKKAIETELRPDAVRMKDKYLVPGTKLVKKSSGSWRG